MSGVQDFPFIHPVSGGCPYLQLAEAEAPRRVYFQSWCTCAVCVAAAAHLQHPEPTPHRTVRPYQVEKARNRIRGSDRDDKNDDDDR